MGKKRRELRKKRFNEVKEWLIHCQTVNLMSEMPVLQYMNFDRVRSILGDPIKDGVGVPGFLDYLRLGFGLILTAFQPGKWHRAIFFVRS